MDSVSKKGIIVIGITGGIGSGKSVISRIIRANGFEVYDCDYEARLLMTNEKNVRKRIIDLLGSDSYDSSGNLNRSFIASLIFKNSTLRKDLNIIVHNAVKENLECILNSKRRGKKFFIESAILFSSGLDYLCDEIWIITSPEKLRFERIKSRDNLSDESIRDRIASQMKEFEKLPEKDIVYIENDGREEILPGILQRLSSTT